MTKREVTVMLRRYDRLRDQLAALEPELNEAVAAYGRAPGRYCFSKDHLRDEIMRDKLARDKP
jgi:hypothetical protein